MNLICYHKPAVKEVMDNMEFKNRKVRHFTYGIGIITDFYPNNRILWVRFENQKPKLYKLPDDFDSGVLSTDDSEINQYVIDYKNSIRYRLHANRTRGQKTRNKDVMEFYKTSCEILDDLGIKYGNVTKVSVVPYNSRYLGCCVHYDDDEKQIEICEDCITDDVSDHDLYTLMLHELIHTCDCGIKHNKKFREYADIIEHHYGYVINRNKRELFYKPIIINNKTSAN